MKYDVRVTVESICRNCDAGLHVGDSFTIYNKACMMVEPTGFQCVEMLNAVLPYCMTYAMGGTFPWENENGEIFVSCPDSYNQLVMKVSRVNQE